MGSDWRKNEIRLEGNGVGLGVNGIELGGNMVGLEGEQGQTREIGLGYKRRGQLIWPYSLPLTTPKPPVSN